MLHFKNLIIGALCTASTSYAFQASSPSTFGYRTTPLQASTTDDASDEVTDSRRNFLTKSTTATAAALFSGFFASNPSPAEAVVYLDPAMYGDQENRVSAVDSLRESVRRAILQKPELSTAFYTLALLDGLSYNNKSGAGGPDGKVVFALLDCKESSPYLDNLKQAAQVLVDAKKALRKLTAITIADAVALGGAESIQAIGGPTLSVQVGRTDAARDKYDWDSALPLDLFEGKKYSSDEVRAFFTRSGMTDREMTALMSGLLTIEKVEKDKDPQSWKQSSKAKFRERGKMGRMSEFKKLSDEDIEKALNSEFDDEDDDEEEDEGWYIADSFGTKDQAFGKKAGDLDPKTFNKYIKDLTKYINAKNPSEQTFGWIGALLLDRNTPSTQQWLAKYGSSILSYEKDLGVAYNGLTQLGAEFTGGKYENLLKNRPRKTLNDF